MGGQAGIRSQYQKPESFFVASETQVSSASAGALYSLKTFSPVLYFISFLKIGPLKAKVWNSPFSPQTSTSAGNELINSRLSSCPARCARRDCVQAITV